MQIYLKFMITKNDNNPSWILKGPQNCHMSWWNFVSCKYAAWNLAQSDRKKCLLDLPLLRKCLTANLILLTRDTMRQTEKGGKVPLFYEIATLMFTIFTWTNNAPCLSPQIWHNLCFQFLLDIAVVPMVLQNFGGKLWQSTLWSVRKCWVQLHSCEVWWKKLFIFFLGINR